jgi:rhodanese-related sulfurtransferase
MASEKKSDSINSSKNKAAVRLTAAIAAIGIGLPLILAWMVLDRSVNVSALEAQRMMQNDSTILVAVDAALAAQLPNAEILPYASIMKMQNPSQLPATLKGKTILLLCPGGIQSARAAGHLRRIGVERTFSIRGGFQEWITLSSVHSIGQSLRLKSRTAESLPHFRPSPFCEQLAAVLTFFGVKFVYSFLAALIVILLWRETTSDLAAMRRSMAAFFIGEGFCFINVVFLGDHNLLLEHLHSIGMVVSLALFFYAMFEFLDSRLIHFSGEGRCILIGLCGACFKHAAVPCGLRRVFLTSAPLLALTSALPIFSSLRDVAYNTIIFGFIYGYRHPIIHQIYELRYLPAAAIILFGFCFFTLLLVERRAVPLSKVLLSAALGAMTFSFFRLLLVAAFVDRQVWFASWEEVTELVYVLLAGCVLVLFPRISVSVSRLLRDREPAKPL